MRFSKFEENDYRQLGIDLLRAKRERQRFAMELKKSLETPAPRPGAWGYQEVDAAAARLDELCEDAKRAVGPKLRCDGLLYRMVPVWERPRLLIPLFEIYRDPFNFFQEKVAHFFPSEFDQGGVRDLAGFIDDWGHAALWNPSARSEFDSLGSYDALRLLARVERKTTYTDGQRVGKTKGVPKKKRVSHDKRSDLVDRVAVAALRRDPDRHIRGTIRDAVESVAKVESKRLGKPVSAAAIWKSRARRRKTDPSGS